MSKKSSRSPVEYSPNHNKYAVSCVNFTIYISVEVDGVSHGARTFIRLHIYSRFLRYRSLNSVLISNQPTINADFPTTPNHQHTINARWRTTTITTLNTVCLPACWAPPFWAVDCTCWPRARSRCSVTSHRQSSQCRNPTAATMERCKL